MRIVSEKTNKEYATVEECMQAEKEFDEKVAEKKAAEEKALAERKAQAEQAIATRKEDAEKVEAARRKMVEANKAYHEALADFCKKHGTYHFSYRVDPNAQWESLFDNFFHPFWF
jgi:uncharacterized protein YgiM (DUF1202 family)